MNCLDCDNKLEVFLDLGSTPLANYLVTKEQVGTEDRYPLRVAFCSKCYLVQITDTVAPSKLYDNYVYFSSTSSSFVRHAKEYVADLDLAIGIKKEDRFLEIASNDGYLLKHVLPYTEYVLGVEPAVNIAAEAMIAGIPTVNSYFNLDLVPYILKSLGECNFIVGNNVLAHVPNINDFIHAVAKCLAFDGTAVFEFPYLPMMINNLEFDTIYHEHVFYYSLLSLTRLFKKSNLHITRIKFSEVHGGSIRIFVNYQGVGIEDSSVSQFLFFEKYNKYDQLSTYANFASKITNLSEKLRHFIINLKDQNKRIAAYGAPAKATTLLNSYLINHNLIDFTVDISPHKQGLYIPGTGIKIEDRSALMKYKPDYTLLLPWNIADEIIEQQQEYLNMGGKFIVPIPDLRIVEK
jgi:hypothetical protein